ncbi:hypothetical protein NQ318_020995 [Aromia moschata]|uniref:Uncharacterized protein n=1 Tax=Aromia moschata TaxID=1265417 RepID=A0AAV8YLL9_9CUCU|nr:hypothetical protein NQ318_020995 [Aromia moschata]
MSDYNISDSEELSSTPPDIREKATNAIENILPEKNTNNVTSFSENVLIAYFQELAEKKKSSTLWTHYSIIKTLLNIKHSIGISKYNIRKKKSKTFSPEEIRTLIDEAPDNQFLFTEVKRGLSDTFANILFCFYKNNIVRSNDIWNYGDESCRRHELHNLRFDHVRNLEGTLIIVNIVETKKYNEPLQLRVNTMISAKNI